MVSAPKLRIDAVSMSFRTPTGVFHALAPITLSIPAGRFVSLIGPSGCGKSTIFNIIAGLLEPSGGQVLIDGIDASEAVVELARKFSVDYSEVRFEVGRAETFESDRPQLAFEERHAECGQQHCRALVDVAREPFGIEVIAMEV